MLLSITLLPSLTFLFPMDKTSPLQGPLLLVTELELISSTTIAGVFYGIAIILYCLYIQSSLSQLQKLDRRRQTKFMLVYTTIVMLCGLVSLGTNGWIIQNAYIKHSNFPGGPYRYTNDVDTTQPIGIICLSSLMMVDILSLAIQVCIFSFFVTIADFYIFQNL